MRPQIHPPLLSALLALPMVGACADDPVSDIDAAVPSGDVEADLLRLREEEKLARDVYLTLGEEWQLPVFSNIAGSEQHHMDQVKELLNDFDIPDPILDDSVGSFASEEFQALYEQLVLQGMESDVDALLVGATIEDLDIYDIRAMRERADNIAVRSTYETLECGSRNHMRAFTGQLDALETEYAAEFIGEQEYLAIVDADRESCGDGNGNQPRGQH